MGTTEDTAGPPLLIYRYAYPASRTGPDLHEQRNARSWRDLGPRTYTCTDARRRCAKINPRRGGMFAQPLLFGTFGKIGRIASLSIYRPCGISQSFPSPLSSLLPVSIAVTDLCESTERTLRGSRSFIASTVAVDEPLRLRGSTSLGGFLSGFLLDRASLKSAEIGSSFRQPASRKSHSDDRPGTAREEGAAGPASSFDVPGLREAEGSIGARTLRAEIP